MTPAHTIFADAQRAANLRTCRACPHRVRPWQGVLGACTCTIGGRTVADRAGTGECVLGRFPHSSLADDGVSDWQPVCTFGSKLGDAIYAMASVKWFAERSTRGMADVRVMSSSSYRAADWLTLLRPLMELQPYIASVEATAQIDGINLEAWRYAVQGKTLAARIATGVGIEEDVTATPWLSGIEPRQIVPVVINRSARYHNDRFPWRRVVEKYRKEAIFIGLPEEHEDFCRRFGNVLRWPTADYLDVAQVIAGSKLFIGNQSSPFAVAAALGHPVLQEVYPGLPDCIFNYPRAVYGWDERVEFPEV